MERKKVVFVIGCEKFRVEIEGAEAELRAAGHIPLSSARIPAELPNEEAMPIYLAMINAADAVLLLPGWTYNSTSQVQFAYCQYIRKPIARSLEALAEVLH